MFFLSFLHKGSVVFQKLDLVIESFFFLKCLQICRNAPSFILNLRRSSLIYIYVRLDPMSAHILWAPCSPLRQILSLIFVKGCSPLQVTTLEVRATDYCKQKGNIKEQYVNGAYIAMIAAEQSLVSGLSKRQLTLRSHTFNDSGQSTLLVSGRSTV